MALWHKSGFGCLFPAVIPVSVYGCCGHVHKVILLYWNCATFTGMKRISFNVFISSGGLRPHWGWNPLRWSALWRVQSINQLSVSSITRHTLPLILGLSSGPAPPAQPGTLSPLSWAAPPKGAYHSWAGASMPSQRWRSESLSSSSHLCVQGDTYSISAGTDNRKQLKTAPPISLNLPFILHVLRSTGRSWQRGMGSAGSIFSRHRRRHHSNWSIWPASIDVLGKPQLVAGLKCWGHQKQALHRGRELIH